MSNFIWTAPEPNFIWTAPVVNYIWSVQEPEPDLDYEDYEDYSDDEPDFLDSNDCDCEFCVQNRLDDTLDLLTDAKAEITTLAREKSDLNSKASSLGLNLQTAQSIIRNLDQDNISLTTTINDLSHRNTALLAELAVKENYLNKAWAYPDSHYTGIDFNLFGFWLSVRFNPLNMMPKIKFGCR